MRELSEPGTPRVAELIADLGGLQVLREAVLEAQASGRWPFVVPDELREDLGAAQFAAAWGALLDGLGPLTRNARPVVSDRALTYDDRRLLVDRPPHHGG